MAGSITTTATQVDSLTKYTIAWTSDASGDVSANSFNVRTGEIVQVEFVPGAGGTQPTDEYDVVVNNANGTDVLAGVGANLSNATRLTTVPVVGTYFRRTVEAGALTPVVSNAGNAKTGTIILLIR